MVKKEYNATETKEGEQTKMLTAFSFSNIGGAPRTIFASSQEEANSIASKLAEDCKQQEIDRLAQ